MLTITNTEVTCISESIVASGFPMLPNFYTESEFIIEVRNLTYCFTHGLIGFDDAIKEFQLFSDNFTMEDDVIHAEKAFKHVKRACKLGKAESSSGHGNFLTGCLVQCNVTYPEYWSPEFQRYHFAQIVSSGSKMHSLKKMSIVENSNQYVDDQVIMHMEWLQKEYKEDPSYENYMKLISNCPMGLEKMMRISTNYMQLLNIWKQRRHHKLQEDWGEFCDWIESLPLFVELTGITIER